MGNLFSKSSGDDAKVGSKRSYDDQSEEQRKKLRLNDPISLVKESDVGIVAYVNPTLKGFHSILKYRAEDFLVNEVDLNKQIVHLTSMEPPKTAKVKTDVYSPELIDEKVTEIFGEEFSKKFRKFLNRPDDKEAILKFVADKEKRLTFYKLVENHLKEELTCRGKEGELIIRWKGLAPEDEYIDWKALGGDYLQVNMEKIGIDTMNAINILCKKASIPTKAVGYAGTKDSRAITTQSLTFKSVKPGKIVAVREELEKSHIRIGNYKFVPNGLTLGDLGGNHFTIVLRDVKGANEADLDVALQSLKDNGFLNYFGMQRFGTSTVLTHTVGCAIMKRNFALASDLILMPRDGDRQEYQVARELWKETGDASAVLAIFPKRAFAERKLLSFYSKNSTNHAKAIKSLPKNMLSLYSHAYQSYIWNKVVSERVRLFGSKQVLVGDIVLVDNKNKNSKFISNDIGRRDLNARKIPYILTEEDIDKYSIEDVVYPLPGKSSVYPENEIKELYRKFMAEDGISMEKRDGHFEGLSGDYRNILVKPDHTQWTHIRYNDPNEQLCNTDSDRLENKPEPIGVPDGKFLALKVKFTLGTSQYATMALREIMRAETSSQAQSSISHD